jgi:hypothetical protein
MSSYETILETIGLSENSALGQSSGRIRRYIPILTVQATAVYQRSLPMAQRSRLARYSRNNTMRIATARRTRSWRSSVVA